MARSMSAVEHFKRVRPLVGVDADLDGSHGDLARVSRREPDEEFAEDAMEIPAHTILALRRKNAREITLRPNHCPRGDLVGAQMAGRRVDDPFRHQGVERTPRRFRPIRCCKIAKPLFQTLQARAALLDLRLVGSERAEHRGPDLSDRAPLASRQ